MSYDTGLKIEDFLVDSHISPRSISINPAFKEYESKAKELIEYNLTGNSKYEETESSKLLIKCKEHAKAFEKPIENKNVIGIVHPFYFVMESGKTLRDTYHPRYAEQCDEYSQNLFKLLESGIDKDKVSLVAFESLGHYAGITSKLLETGAIDRVVFTENHSGALLHQKSAKQFHDKNMYLGGGFDTKCLTTTGSTLKNHPKRPAKISGINGLIVTHPAYSLNDSILPEQITHVAEGKQMITLDKLIEKFRV
jgi:hypothetical protein